MKKKYITIWDIDKTLYKGYVIIDFGKYLEDIGYFEKNFSSRVDESLRRYQEGTVSYDSFAKSVYTIYGDNIFNKNQFEILQLSKVFWETSISNLYKASLGIYKLLNSMGSDHVAISGSSFESLYYLLDKLGFSKMKATEYETVEGNYTKKIVSTLASHSDKSRLSERVLNQKNKYEVTIGLGDNYADLSFLELVDYPIIIGTKDTDLMMWGESNEVFIVDNPERYIDSKLLMEYLNLT
jgi:phosphoserine phosphatase